MIERRVTVMLSINAFLLALEPRASTGPFHLLYLSHKAAA